MGQLVFLALLIESVSHWSRNYLPATNVTHNMKVAKSKIRLQTTWVIGPVSSLPTEGLYRIRYAYKILQVKNQACVGLKFCRSNQEKNLCRFKMLIFHITAFALHSSMTITWSVMIIMVGNASMNQPANKICSSIPLSAKVKKDMALEFLI
jgi:hypothetical protein